NGTSWSFAYDSYADLTSITFPTGGSLNYSWQSLTRLPFNLQGISQAITSRRINGGQPWSYSWGAYSNLTATNVVTDPLLNDTAYTMTQVLGGSYPYET